MILIFARFTAVFCVLISSAWADEEVDLFQSSVLTAGWIPARWNPRVGEALDLSVKRPVAILDGTAFENFYGRVDGTSLVANFYHRGKFWVARVPNYGVINEYVGFSYFTSVIAHELLRYQFDPQKPVELLGEVPTQEQYAKWQFQPALAHPIRLTEVAFSPEAAWTVNDPLQRYSPLSGALGRNASVIRFVSMEDRFRSYFFTAHTTPMRRVLRTRGESNRSFWAALVRSERDGVATHYNTFTNNCSITVLRILRDGQAPALTPCESLRRVFSRLLVVGASIPSASQYYGLAAKGFPLGETIPMEKDPTLEATAISAFQSLRPGSFASSKSLTPEKKRALLDGLVRAFPRFQDVLCQSLLESAPEEAQQAPLAEAAP